MKQKKVISVKTKQLELNFSLRDCKKDSVNTHHSEVIFVRKFSGSGRIINFHEGVKQIEKIKEREVIQYILEHSKRF